MEDTIQSYAEELKLLVQKGHDAFETQLNYISAGALGLSMLLVEKVVKDLSHTKANWLLVLSWSFFAATLISNLLSHIYAANCHDKTLAEIYADGYNDKAAGRRNKRFKRWNIVSISLLFTGIVAQIIFISINI